MAKNRKPFHDISKWPVDKVFPKIKGVPLNIEKENQGIIDGPYKPEDWYGFWDEPGPYKPENNEK